MHFAHLFVTLAVPNLLFVRKCKEKRVFLLHFAHLFVTLQAKEHDEMKKLKKLCLRVYRIKALKYVLVIVIAIVMIGFVDENSVWQHFQNKQHIGELKEEIARYTEQNMQDLSLIHRIDSDPKLIEKIARERYFMKADDEDIFVLSDDKER